jgi:F1F0 ATPase subunit 2
MNEFMSPVSVLLLALLAGALLGMFFFVGLWWTVRKLESTNHVALLFFSSMIVRTGVAISGFYFILGDNWQRLVAGLLGFVIARIIVTRLTRIKEQSKNTITAGSS